MAKSALSDSVFIFGPGRSGTTIFFRMLACHSEFGWLSNWNEKMPAVPQLSVFSRMRAHLDKPGSRKGIFRYFPVPGEAIAVPRRVTRSHFQSNSIITDADVDSQAVDDYREYLGTVLRWQGKARLLHKHTGFARISFLSRVDPTAKFIRIVRDGRAVVNSLLNVSWWDGTMDTWWWDDMKPEYIEEYERSGKDSVVLAGIVWKTIMDMQESEIAAAPGSALLTVKYDDFVADPKAKLRDSCEHAGVVFTEEFQRVTGTFRITNQDSNWQKELSKEQIDLLNKSLGGHLEGSGFAI
jgi:hypothetical protein